MAQNNVIRRKVSYLNSTLRLKWELTREEFDKCVSVGDDIRSTTYSVKIGDEESEWMLFIYPRGDDEENKDKVITCLGLVNANKVYKVQFKFRVKTPAGFWPDDFAEMLFKKQKRDKFLFDSKSIVGHYCGLTKDFREKFIENKMTIEATLVIDMEEAFETQMDIVDDFIDDMHSAPDLGHLQDFTIICKGKEFPGYKLFLSLRSKFFKAMFVFDKNKTKIEIDDSSPEMVFVMLKFMSDGDMPKDIVQIAMDLIPVTDKYGPESLTKVCAESIMNNLSPENAVESLILIDRHQHDLRSKVLKFIRKEAVQVVNSNDWDKFVKEFPALVKDIILAMAETPSNSEAEISSDSEEESSSDSEA